MSAERLQQIREQCEKEATLIAEATIQQYLCDRILPVLMELDQAQRELEAWRKCADRLENYATHTPTCVAGKCDCGLNEVLSEYNALRGEK